MSDATDLIKRLTRLSSEYAAALDGAEESSMALAAMANFGDLSLSLIPSITKALEAAPARIAELEAERGWQPIETAPKDGTRVLLLVPPYGATTAHWGEMVCGNFRWFAHSVLNSDAQPTHWMPLPAPPQDTEEDG